MFSTFIFFISCNTKGANGIFYAITQEVESGKSNLDVKLTTKGMFESENHLFLMANGIHVAFKDSRKINDKVWTPLNNFGDVKTNDKTHHFLQTKSSSANCKDAIIFNDNGQTHIIASFSIDDDYNAYQSVNNPEYNKDFRINRLFHLTQSDIANPTSWKWVEIPLVYPAMKHSYDKVYRQMEIERIFFVNNQYYFLFNEKFIRKKYYIVDENGKEIPNTEQAVKSPYFTLYRVDNIFSSSPTFTEIAMPSEKDRVSSIVSLFSFRKESKNETWFATKRNLYSIQDDRANQIDIYVSAGTGNSGYYLNSRIESISAVHLAAPSPYLTEDQKTLNYNGNRFQINQDDTLFMAVTYINKKYDKVNRLFRYTKTVSESIGSNLSTLVFDWNWSECLIEGQDNSDLIIYNIGEYYSRYKDSAGETKTINKLVLGTNDGYLEAEPGKSVPQFITVNYDDKESTSAANLATLLLESASVVGFYCSDKGSDRARLYAFTASNGLWKNHHKIWSRE